MAGNRPPWLTGFDPTLVSAVLEAPLAEFLTQANQHAAKQGLCTGQGQAARFVFQAAALTAAGYERHIARTGEIPTRDNLHDRYNALIWLTFAQTKAVLNRLQVAEMEGETTTRGPRRDALTLWDENLALVCVPPGRQAPVQQLFAQHQWQELFVACRGAWHREWRPLVFGHALLEKLTHPFKAITAHLLVVEGETPGLQALDTRLATELPGLAGPQAFLHLPILGVPGWDPDNRDPSFYSDPSVFRPARPGAPPADFDPRVPG